MSKRSIFIVGAGGHSKVAAEIIESADWEVVAYIDEGTHLNEFYQRPVYTSLEQAEKHHQGVKNAFVAIGANESRKQWYNILKKNNYNTPHFIHKTAWISSTAKIESGALICAHAVVGASAIVGVGSIINCGAILDHDASIGAFSHMSQGVIAAGGSKIGRNALLCPGCIVEKVGQVPDGALIPSGTIIVTARQ